MKKPTLGFKITNLRTKNYPDVLEETDYHGFKVGDLIKGRAKNLIYEVIKIFRSDYTQQQYLSWMRLVGGIDHKAVKLLEKYEKTGRFGVCKIQAKVILRDGVAPKRAGSRIFTEIDETPYVTTTHIKKTDLIERIMEQDKWINYHNRVINKSMAKRDMFVKVKEGIVNLHHQRLGITHPVQVTVSEFTGQVIPLFSNGALIGSILPEDLL